MTEQLNDGGPAFPQARSTGLISVGLDGSAVIDKEMDGGMSLRDWFAGQAAAAMLVNHEWDAKALARDAYAVADAMLAARGAK